MVEQTLDDMIANVILTTEEEKAVVEHAIRQAKIDKYWKIRDERIREMQRALVADAKKPFTWQEQFQYLYIRCDELKIPRTVLDSIIKQDEEVVTLLCKYFTDDPDFEKMGNNFSLKKGIWMYGFVGTGKTTLMRLFARNKKRCFDISECIQLQNLFMNDGEKLIEAMRVNRMEPKDIRYFFQQEIGRMFDDLGSEETETLHFGNKRNVMADIIKGRYAMRSYYGFEYTHITTNKTTKEMETLYGTRVYDRLFDMFNFLGMKGDSLRGKL